MSIHIAIVSNNRGGQYGQHWLHPCAINLNHNLARELQALPRRASTVRIEVNRLNGKNLRQLGSRFFMFPLRQRQRGEKLCDYFGMLVFYKMQQYEQLGTNLQKSNLGGTQTVAKIDTELLHQPGKVSTRSINSF